MFVRFALVAVAAVLVVLLAGRLSDDRACSDASGAAFRIGLGQPAADAPDDIAADLREHCRDAEKLANGGHALTLAGEEIGLELAEDAVRREPESFTSWMTLARIQRKRGLDAGRAERRARRLNPRWRPAEQPAVRPVAGAPGDR